MPGCAASSTSSGSPTRVSRSSTSTPPPRRLPFPQTVSRQPSPLSSDASPKTALGSTRPLVSFRYWAPPKWPRIVAGFAALTPELRRSGVGLLAGTDWSSSLESRGAPIGESLHDELAEMVTTGFSPAEALRSATSAPARFLGLSQTLGTVAAGKTADLVVVEADPLHDIRATRRVVTVFRNGRRFASAHSDFADLTSAPSGSAEAPRRNQGERSSASGRWRNRSSHVARCLGPVSVRNCLGRRIVASSGGCGSAGRHPGTGRGQSGGGSRLRRLEGRRHRIRPARVLQRRRRLVPRP